ncbi:MAG: hypothetical protein IIB36_06125 [Gemmatimonadetes bacterium]|nr:hypothetical protein [Gemmatimonadota bacterium]
MTRPVQRGRRGLLTLAILTVAVLADATVAASTTAAQQRRVEPPPPTLRAKPHQTSYWGVLEVVGAVDGREQYRIGPDTILLGIDVYEDDDGNMIAEYTLDVGEGDPSVGTMPFSELGLEADQWRPTLEALTLVSFLPLPVEPQEVGGEWAKISGYTLPDLDLDFAEATRFSIESIEGEEVTISYSAKGGGSTVIDQPHLGPDAKMQVTRESAREGTFVFHVGEGRVLSAERLERIVTTSVFYLGDEEPRTGPEESQTVTFQLLPSNGSR